MIETNIGIYAFTSKVSGFCYIGQSINLARRKRDHLRELGKDSHKSRHLQFTFNKYGPDQIEYSVLEYCDKDELTANEQKWMDIFRPTGLFNVAPAANTQRGMIYGPEVRERMSASKRGKVASIETRQKISMAAIGRIFSPAHCENIKISKSGKVGRPQSPETKARIALALTGKTRTPEHIANQVAAKKRNGNTLLGIRLSEEHKAKIGAANKGRANSPEAIAQMVATKRRNYLARKAQPLQ